jgi:hypothetical protein
MENWKKAVLGSAGGLALVFLLKGSRSGALIFGGVALAALASEYPEAFAEIRKKVPQYVERGTAVLDMASRIGERLADIAETRGTTWYEALLSG